MDGPTAYFADLEFGLGDALFHLEDAGALGAFVLVGRHNHEG